MPQTLSFDLMLKCLFFILSVFWIRAIMLYRNEKQVIITPILFFIASLLAIIPDNMHIFSINTTDIKLFLYIIYIITNLFGLFVLSKKDKIYY